MPRDTLGAYTKPAGIDGVAGNTIESIKYNSFTSDVEHDLNVARPIVAGGTGATSAAAAITALGGETADQVVTNYDMFVFKSGSFKSAAGVTAAPTGIHSFYGTANVYDVNNILLEARGMSGTGLPTGPTYLREKSLIAGVPTWGTWITVPSPADAAVGLGTKVSKTGDTMTGGLTISGGNPLILSKTSGQYALIYGGGSGGAAQRWRMDLGDAAPESGGNAGSNFAIHRWDDAGGFLGTAFSITRQTGQITQGNTTINTTLSVASSITAPIYYTNGTNYILTDGTSLILRSNGAVATQNTGGVPAPFSCGTIGAGAIGCGAITCSTINTQGNVINTVGGHIHGGSFWWNGSASIHGMTFDGSNLILRQGSGNTYFQDGGGTERMLIDTSGNVRSAGFMHVVGGQIYMGPTSAPVSVLRTTSGYTALCSTTGVEFLLAGGGGDYQNYYNNENHHFYNSNRTVDYGSINSTGFHSNSGVTANSFTTGGNVNTGGVVASGDITCTNLGASGSIRTPLWYVDDTSARYLHWNGSGNVDVVGVANFNQANGQFTALGDCNIQGHGYQPGGGAWIDNSDERIKTVKGDYEGGLDEVLALQPRRFVYKGNDTNKPPSNQVRGLEQNDDGKSEPTVPYRNSSHYQHAVDQTEFVGFVAQEAETVMPELVKKITGHIDGVEVDDLRVVDTSPLVYALINATKELTARIDGLHERIKELEGAATPSKKR